LAVLAVTYKPVSSKISLLSGKSTGKRAGVAAKIGDALLKYVIISATWLKIVVSTEQGFLSENRQ
jgi:hypothetical protein